jgi:hypothetical protein
MVKRSPEHRSGELYRNGFDPPKPPSDLRQPEKALWTAIAASRPVDWFTPATMRLLRRFVRMAIYAEKLHDALDTAPIGSAAAVGLLRQVIACNGSLGILASKMRLSAQVTISARSTGRMAERGSLIMADPLLGGHAVRGRHPPQ